jgi:putative oxidoreductase
MKIAAMIARYLMGLGFLVFGLNGFLNFIPQPPIPPGPMADYLAVMMKTHYMIPVSALELISGILLLINRYVPLALTFLAPILVNIIIFHCVMQLSGLPMALVFVAMWFLVFARVRSAFSGILQNQPAA